MSGPAEARPHNKRWEQESKRSESRTYTREGGESGLEMNRLGFGATCAAIGCSPTSSRDLSDDREGCGAIYGQQGYQYEQEAFELSERIGSGLRHFRSE